MKMGEERKEEIGSELLTQHTWTLRLTLMTSMDYAVKHLNLNPKEKETLFIYFVAPPDF